MLGPLDEWTDEVMLGLTHFSSCFRDARSRDPNRAATPTNREMHPRIAASP